MQYKREEILQQKLSEMPVPWRVFWCEAQMCACMGCANRSGGLTAAGFTKEEWEQALSSDSQVVAKRSENKNA